MKKRLLLLLAISLFLVSCTDNQSEHEELLKAQQSIEKGGSTHQGGNGETLSNNKEE